MNILIVGNGFDLSHYLPTKYDHFMDVMRAIEEKDTGGLPKNLEEMKIDEWLNLIDKTFQKREGMEQPPHHMNFDELFLEMRDSNFIVKTKEYYLTDSILFSAQDVIKAQYRLSLNCWYQYFKSHVEEIKTWIDFEQKIEEVLISLAHCVIDIEKANTHVEIRNYLNLKSKEQWKIKEKNFRILEFFELWKDEEYVSVATIGASVKSKRPSLNSIFCHGEDIKNGFNPASFLEFIYRQLDEFIEIFNLYLILIIDKLEPKGRFEIFTRSNSLFALEENNWTESNKIYSFNYTKTYQKFYDQSVETDYLHGSFGKEQNIVLGVSELEDDSLIKLKAFGFTKYHQKLFKDTDYLFLDEYKSKICENTVRLENFEKNFSGDLSIKGLHIANIIKDEIFNLNVSIWGHSLDVSDKEYIVDLFGLNDGMDRNVRVTVYYFDENAKFALLNNLLAILKKDKVEKWMKKGWLKFEKNPQIKFGAIISEKTA